MENISAVTSSPRCRQQGFPSSHSCSSVCSGEQPRVGAGQAVSQTICVCSTHEQLFIPIRSQEMLLVPCSCGRWDCFFVLQANCSGQLMGVFRSAFEPCQESAGVVSRLVSGAQPSKEKQTPRPWGARC